VQDSGVISSIRFHRRDAESAKKRYFSFSVERTENNKINNLGVLCGSNERSE